MPKLLLFRGSPRSDIEQVEKWNHKLPCDMIIIRYTHEIPAYREAREYFLRHTEYDYLVLATDDIIVLPKNVRQLQRDLDKRAYLILSGMMNVDEDDFPDGKHNISHDLPNKLRSARIWNFIKPSELEPKFIFLVGFAGFALTAVHRRVVEQIQFAGDGAYGKYTRDEGASLDLVFAYDCKDLNIPMFVDRRIKMHHLRLHGTFNVGKIKPTTEIINVNKIITPPL